MLINNQTQIKIQETGSNIQQTTVASLDEALLQGVSDIKTIPASEIGKEFEPDSPQERSIKKIYKYLTGSNTDFTNYLANGWTEELNSLVVDTINALTKGENLLQIADDFNEAIKNQVTTPLTSYDIYRLNSYLAEYPVNGVYLESIKDDKEALRTEFYKAIDPVLSRPFTEGEKNSVDRLLDDLMKHPNITQRGDLLDKLFSILNSVLRPGAGNKWQPYGWDTQNPFHDQLISWILNTMMEPLVINI